VLVLSRKVDEKLLIGDCIEILVVEVRGDKVRLGITAPRQVPVHRHEVLQRIAAAQAARAAPEPVECS
jgi:carbon storage regulator